jgi:hypothetical protein
MKTQIPAFWPEATQCFNLKLETTNAEKSSSSVFIIKQQLCYKIN